MYIIKGDGYIMKIQKLLGVVLYVEDGIFSENNRWINLHLLISKFLCYALIGSIAVEMQVKIVESLNGDSTFLKFSALLGLIISLFVNGFLTKRKYVEKARRWYCVLSLVGTLVLILTNAIVVIDDCILVRFILNTIMQNSIITVLNTSISDTINNLFQGTDKTIYQQKKQVISILASLVGMVLAFFISLDLNGLLIFESLIYGVMCLDDLFIMRRLQKQVFGEAEDSPNTELKEAA